MNPASRNQGVKGFTLIELLVVIAIIALLSTTAYVNFGRARIKAVDVLRLTEIRAILQALTIYHSDYGHWPDPPITFYPEDGSKCSFTSDSTNCHSYYPCVSQTTIPQPGTPNDRNWIEDFGPYFIAGFPPQDPTLRGLCKTGAIPPSSQSRFHYRYEFFEIGNFYGRDNEFEFTYYISPSSNPSDFPGQLQGCETDRCEMKFFGMPDGQLILGF